MRGVTRFKKKTDAPEYAPRKAKPKPIGWLKKAQQQEELPEEGKVGKSKAAIAQKQDCSRAKIRAESKSCHAPQ